MKNSVELRQERASLIEESNVMLETCKTEARNLNEDEQVSYDAKMESIDKLKKDIEMVERQEKLNAEIASNVASAPVNEPTEVRDYSFFKAIQGSMNGNLDGIEREMHEEAVNEARNAGRSINGLGIPSFILEQRANVSQVEAPASGIAGTNILGFADAMREASVFDKVGANILTNLSANTTIPVTGTSTVAWEGEIDAAADGGTNFGKVELTPNRLAAYVNISKQLLMQNGAGAEQAIIRDLGRAVGQKMDAAIFSTANAGGGAPTSLGQVATGSITSDTTYDASSVFSDLVAAEGALAEAGGLEGNLAYVCSPALLKDIKQAAQVAGVSAGFQGGIVNGYKSFFTNGCTKVADTSADFFFGDFSKLYIGMFGGLDILVDPYTVAANGQTKLVLNQFMDWGVSNGAGFVKATSLTA
jgi:HK97 family phage major capsid protein